MIGMKSIKRNKNSSGFLLVTHHSLLITNVGFTLLEVMISLAIVGGLLITLIYTLNYNIGLAERHETVTVATFLAKEKIVETERHLKNSEGNFEKPYAEYHYTGKVSESFWPGILEISVVVNKGRESVTLNKLVRGKGVRS